MEVISDKSTNECGYNVDIIYKRSLVELTNPRKEIT